MKDNAKKFIKKVKSGMQEVGACVCEFAADTVDYIGDHPIVIPILTYGAIKTMAFGIQLANLSCIEVNKTGTDTIFYGKKWTKLEKSMTLQDWLDYLENMYEVKWNKKKQKNYLKDNGFIK